MEQKRIGWFCTYTPVELIEAAGQVPAGIRADCGMGHEDVYLGDAICSYVRSCLGGALTGRYDDCDAVVIAHSCECMRRLYDGWTFNRESIVPECMHLLDVPRVRSERGIAFFAGEIRRFRAALEERYGAVSDDAIRESIRLSNRTRELFAKLCEQRKQDPPPVTGAEVAALVRRSAIAPRGMFNRELEDFIAEAAVRREPPRKPRIMVYTGPGNEKLIAAVEDAGGVIVGEQSCNGSRMFDGIVDESGDLIEALARRYLCKSPCPRMIGDFSVAGMIELKRAVREYRADGVIYYAVKFCANLQAGWAAFRSCLGENVPVKMIEGEIGSEINEREIQSFVKRLSRKRGMGAAEEVSA